MLDWNALTYRSTIPTRNSALASLAKELLADLLKSTEAFNKLKKMNDQLKS
jgi:hypothetical protein